MWPSMSVLTVLHAFMGQLEPVSSFFQTVEAECDKFSRVLDSGGVSCPEDSCRFYVDVDLGLLELGGLSGRLSWVACSVDIWRRIPRHPPVSYPGLQNASLSNYLHHYSRFSSPSFRGPPFGRCTLQRLFRAYTAFR
ncbi:hypothetical protein EDB86DRAFT_2888106, partial [Lactarius hatsudake]